MFDELPVAAGELEVAMRIRENNLMVLFSIIPTSAFMLSSVFVLVKYKEGSKQFLEDD